MNKEKIIKENDIIDLREKSEEDVIDAYSKISQKPLLVRLLIYNKKVQLSYYKSIAAR